MTLHESPPGYLDECRDALSTEQAKSLAETNNWSHVDKTEVHTDWGILYEEIAPLIDSSLPSSPVAQALIDRHFSIISHFYSPSKKAYIGLALFYDENPEMKAYHNSFHPKMVEFLGDGMFFFANSKL